jgi:hypothetical protein
LIASPTEIVTPGTISVVLHNCKYALVTRRRGRS